MPCVGQRKSCIWFRPGTSCLPRPVPRCGKRCSGTLPTGVVNEVGLHHGWARRRNVRRIRASTQERIGRPTDGKITLMMNTKTVIPLLAFLAGFARLGAATPIDIGDRLELFVDRHLIERMDDVRLELGRPRAEEIVFHFNEPWEGSTSGAYFTVIQDGDLHRMYYRGRSVGRDDKAVQVTCYAESRDGIRWEKPKLRIHDYNGSTSVRSSIRGPVCPRRNGSRQWAAALPGASPVSFRRTACIGASSGPIRFLPIMPWIR
jgi:hypothetical protein